LRLNQAFMTSPSPRTLTCETTAGSIASRWSRRLSGYAFRLMRIFSDVAGKIAMQTIGKQTRGFA